MPRPEYQGPADLVYHETEARKYARNPRNTEIQTHMAERCLELLNLPESGPPHYLLDIGCGTGFSTAVLQDAGHYCVGTDISESMLLVGQEEETDEDGNAHLTDTLVNDIGQGLPFRAGSFHGAISVSAIQWLLHATSKEANPFQRMARFFSSLYHVLTRGARAALQFYPENAQQADLLTKAAMKAGFTGGVVVDFPHSAKAKKFYLCLFTGGQAMALPKAIETEETQGVAVVGSERVRRKKGGVSKKNKKDKAWVLRKKESARQKGKEDVPMDTKYTARKRRPKF